MLANRTGQQSLYVFRKMCARLNANFWSFTQMDCEEFIHEILGKLDSETDHILYGNIE